MKTAESDPGAQDDKRSGPRSSRSGSFGRSLSEIEPRQLSESDLAYLRFFLLALHSSVKEVRHRVADRALVIDVCVGIDLLIENADRRFGFPLLSPEHQRIPPNVADQLTLEANLSKSPNSRPSPPSLSDQSTPHEQSAI
jgi:hypothetical protein